MGTTRDALNAGSANFVLVAACEGYSEIWTNHDDTAAVATAWSGTGWSTVKGGLIVDLQINQGMNPDEPIIQAGTCTLHMLPQGLGTADVFGVAVGKKTSTYQTYLDADLTAMGTSVTVKSTTGWPSSGYLHIGTECIAYSAIADSTHFTVSARGCFTPFGSYDDYINSRTTNSFAHVHTVTDDANSINLAPVVSSSPRSWIGRWMGVWAHRVVSGVLDVKAQAELLFAGRIEDIRDDPNTGAVVVSLRPASDLSDVTIGQQQWQGSAEEGVYLATGDVFRFGDNGNIASNLVVQASGATGAYQVNAGTYTLGSLCSVLSIWLAQAKADAAIDGIYTISAPVTIQPSGELRTEVCWQLPGAAVFWFLSVPRRVSAFLGFEEIAKPDPAALANRFVLEQGPGSSSVQKWTGGGTPNSSSIEMSDGVCEFVTNVGGIVDQSSLLSSLSWMLASAISNLGGTWAMFSVGSRIALAKYTATSDGYLLEYINTMFLSLNESKTPDYSPISIAAGDGSKIKFRQIYLLQGDMITMVVSLLCSIGTTGYNSPYAALPTGCSASVPYELVRSLPNTMSGLSGITGPTGGITILLDKPTKLIELLRSDLMIRMVFLMWRDGEISMGEWKAPVSLDSVASLTDSNKAEPAGHTANQLSATAETSEWVRPIVKVRYNRNPTDPTGDDYRDLAEFIDSTSIDDMGGTGKTVTINLRNAYDGLTGPGQSIASLLTRFLSVVPLISRPVRKVTRSIDSRYFLQLAPGDVVTITDLHARDPETGLRGLTDRPALVAKISYNFGGSDIGGGTTPMGGQVDLVFSDQNPDKVGAPYVPAGMVNDLYTVGSYDHGYNDSTKTLRLLSNRFTETTDTGGRDAAFFNPGDLVTIVERDPSDPDAPVKWTRTIAASGVSGDDLTFTAALSSPSWDNTKQYYVISQTYSVATTTQHRNTYQADATDALIENTSSPYLYGSGGASATYTTNAGLAALYPFSNVNTIEMPPTLCRIDGAGRDVAWEAVLTRLGDNLIDYKYAPQLPMLSNVVMSNTTVTGTGRQLVSVFPIFLNFEILSSVYQRYARVAPWAYSTDGTSTKIRVTISRDRPSFTTTDNVTWTGVYSQYEWTGITSTTPATLTEQELAVNVKDGLGEAWVSIELGYKCATRGLAQLVVGPREQILLQAV